MDSAKIEIYAPVILKLLREIITTSDKEAWTLLLDHEYLVQDYFNRIGLEVYINRSDGYAYVQQPELDREETSIKLPRLTRRVSLNARQTLMILLLREKLDEFLNHPQDSDELILNIEEIYLMFEPFIPSGNDQRTIHKTILTTANKLADMGFLKYVSQERKTEFIVPRVLKSKVSTESIARLKAQLMEHFNNDFPDTE